MPDVRSVTIIGGGVIGCFLAYRLALEGVPVTVIERQSVGAGATGASAGNVQPGVMGGIVDAQGVLGTLGAQSLRLHRTFLPAIKESSGLDPLDHEVQYFYAALDAQEVAETQHFAAALQAHTPYPHSLTAYPELTHSTPTTRPAPIGDAPRDSTCASDADHLLSK